MAEEKKPTATRKPRAKKVEAPVVEEEAPVVEATPKKTTKKKAEKVVEAPKKPMPTEARAIAKNVRVTPRKVRLVIDLVRGKDVKEAMGILANLNKAAATPVSKLIKSAAANATNNFGMDEVKLYVATIYANDGLRMKRYMPRAKGSASGLVRRCSHITVVVKMR